jgi:hypothetical protein
VAIANEIATTKPTALRSANHAASTIICRRNRHPTVESATLHEQKMLASHHAQRAEIVFLIASAANTAFFLWHNFC